MKKIGLLFIILLYGCTDTPWNNPHSSDLVASNTFFSSFSERPKHLDPARAYSSSEYQFLAQIYEPPLQYHFLKRPYELIPATAVALPKQTFLNQNKQPIDGKNRSQIAYTEYEFTLKKGIQYQPHPALAKSKAGNYLYHHLSLQDIADKFQLSDFQKTGTRELIADDYVYQIKRLAFSALGSPIKGLMSDLIDGFKDYSKEIDQAWKAQKKQHQGAVFWFDLRNYDLDGVVALDRYRYKIRVKGLYPQFLYWTAMPFFAPMPWEAEAFYQQQGMKKKNITLHWYPIGTGPFMLTENNPNSRMILEKNPFFHPEFFPSEGEAEDQVLLADAGKKLPLIERAIYSLEKENIPRWTKFLQGYYDTSGISSDSFDQAIQFGSGGQASLTDEMQAKGIKLSTAVESSIFYMGFNMLDPVVGGKSERARLLRQAISIAVDFDEYIAIFNNGRGIPAQSPLPPNIFGYKKAGFNPIVYQQGKYHIQRKDIAIAQSLMTQAGYENGIDPQTGKALVLNYDTTASGPDSKANLNWYMKQFKKLGIELVIRGTDYNRFQSKMRAGKAQIFSWGWNADYPDPENFFFLLYGKNSKVKYKGENAANYQNPEFDRLFEQMKSMLNSPQRQTIIDQMTAIVQQDAPWLFGFHPQAFSLVHPWYLNSKPHIMANNTLKYKRIDANLRVKQQQQFNQPIVWPFIILICILLLCFIPAIKIWHKQEKSAGIVNTK